MIPTLEDVARLVATVQSRAYADVVQKIVAAIESLPMKAVAARLVTVRWAVLLTSLLPKVPAP